MFINDLQRNTRCITRLDEKDPSRTFSHFVGNSCFILLTVKSRVVDWSTIQFCNFLAKGQST